MSSVSEVLPRELYTAAGVRALDRIAIAEHGIPGRTLMERAGRAAFEVLQGSWPGVHRLAVLCGSGNNGGDGFVLARLARLAGLAVTVVQVGDPAHLPADAAASRDALRDAGLTPVPWNGQDLRGFDLLIDSLLGTGIDREVTGDYAAAIRAVNAGDTPVLAVDLPSGLNADTGQVMGVAVRAAATVTFVGMKRGLLTGDAPDYCGCLYFSDLDIPRPAYTAVPASAERIDRHDYRHMLSRRPRTAHKGQFGHVLVVGGDHGYAGAARMAAAAAGRVGAGLLSVATRPAHVAPMLAGLPEAMVHGVANAADLRSLARRATVLAVGPGLGQSDWSAAMLAAILDLRLPTVMDADALNLLAADRICRDHWILTPHPGEAGRLLGCSTAEVQVDRYAAVRAIRGRYGGVCVLKGAGTLVDDGQGPIGVCAQGNPGMASGGMGDVLTGVVAGLLAQGLNAGEAARMAVCLHAEAADLAARDGERGLLATDLLPWLRRLVNP
jgi:NAD(P)H-hydrate epimerase